MSYSANAIYTKARAMYGRRLTPQNYIDMMNCPHVADVANYLGTNTQYSEVFSDVQITAISRVLLEETLKKHMFNQFASLSHFEKAIGQELYKYFVIRSEIEQILSCIRYLRTPNKDDYLLSMPAFLNRHTNIDLFKLAKAQTFGEVIDSLSGTEYKKLLTPYMRSDGQYDLLLIESVLQRYLYRTTQKIAEKSLRGREREEFLEAVHIEADMQLIRNIYRLKRFFHVPPDKMFNYIKVTYHVTNLNEKQIKALLATETAEDFLEMLGKTYYGKKLHAEELITIEDWTNRYQYEWTVRKLRFSTYPSVVMFCCILLAENEIMNIIHIEEGIKYHIPVDEIKRMLIGWGEMKDGENEWQ